MHKKRFYFEYLNTFGKFHHFKRRIRHVLYQDGAAAAALMAKDMNILFHY